MQQIERNEIFDLAYRFVTETAENIFLTGKAGTGKTTFLKYLKEHCTKNTIVAAPTGVAAINAGGVTLHSLFQLPFHPFLPTKNSKDDLLAKTKIRGQRQEMLRKMELLIIDEISMVRCDTLDAIDTILRSIRRKHHLPFGGVQLLCIGDLHQLPPVAQTAEWNILSEYYQSPFFFDSLVIKEQMPLLIELTKIYRQKEESFVELLNKVRTNNMQQEELEELNRRFISGFSPTHDEHFITLTSHNAQADNINVKKLAGIIYPSFKYKAEIEGDFLESQYPAEAELELKVGAQVMFLKNDTIGKKYFNGKIGIVSRLEKEKILVDCDGEEITVQQETWENSRYNVNRQDGKLEEEIIGRFTQYPLKLAWAITIHKSQGLTFEKVMIDAASAFSSGQVYVALSRCTSLDGIVLLSRIPSSAIQSSEHVLKSQQSLSHKGSLAERFEGARKLFTQQLMEEVFSFKEIETETNLLHFHINHHIDKLNDGAASFAEKIKLDITRLKNTGLKFYSQAEALLKDEGVIEKNEPLQKRINAAAVYFIPLFEGFLKLLHNHLLITEHKEPAQKIDEHLNAAALTIHELLHLLQYCKQSFSVTQFLQHKLKYARSRFAVTCYAAGIRQKAGSSIPNAELYDTLRRWRDMLIADTGLPVYSVAKHDSLVEICTYLPFTKKDLLELSGFGKAKADAYGDEIIDAVLSYCSRHNLETNMAAKKVNPKKIPKEKSTGPKIDTKSVSFSLYKEGKNIADIAKERNLAASTIEGHLAHYIASGELNIDDFVTKDRQQKIHEAIAVHGAESHKLLLENLPSGYDYGEIRMVLAAEKRN